ncbi:GntR family transcriptional regulator [Agromyces sp. Root81]|uniref:GntR family transcriptional regulator n=1 Tax=Agromyces sp. Root81 TaxID=1736601 RepID=UPI0009EB9EB7|nr:GntR family transcriptional regulator [Agromyces sp. Root81]
MTNTSIRTAEDIAQLFRGAIQTGQLGDGERLPTVRQTARDFNVAQATAAKAYKTIEHEGLVVTRTAAGTRVAPGASRAPQLVVERARSLAEAADAAGVSLEDTIAIVKSVWRMDEAPATPDGLVPTTWQASTRSKNTQGPGEPRPASRATTASTGGAQ